MLDNKLSRCNIQFRIDMYHHTTAGGPLGLADEFLTLTSNFRQYFIQHSRNSRISRIVEENATRIKNSVTLAHISYRSS